LCSQWDTDFCNAIFAQFFAASTSFHNPQLSFRSSWLVELENCPVAFLGTNAMLCLLFELLHLRSLFRGPAFDFDLHTFGFDFRRGFFPNLLTALLCSVPLLFLRVSQTKLKAKCDSKLVNFWAKATQRRT